MPQKRKQPESSIENKCNSGCPLKRKLKQRRNYGRELTKRKKENKISRRTNKKKKLKKVKMLKKILQNNT